MLPTPPVERRKSYCPECGTRGNPTTVTFGSESRTISYKCSTCGVEWLAQTPNQELTAEPQNS
jgi:DNA-directed RNA polymerase subunit RPC12/RpoP